MDEKPRMMIDYFVRKNQKPIEHEETLYCSALGCVPVRTPAKDAQIQAINVLAKECYDIAEEHGWWDEHRTFGDLIALVHTELSEALEAFRDDRLDDIPEELADVVIRIFDMSHQRGFNIGEVINLKMEKNRRRPYRHGGKKL